jgi:hypothetical protein
VFGKREKRLIAASAVTVMAVDTLVLSILCGEKEGGVDRPLPNAYSQAPQWRPGPDLFVFEEVEKCHLVHSK